MIEHKKHIIKLFNTGKLKLEDAEWYHKQGYAFEIKSGKVVDIYLENNFTNG